ncbi:hypothetical protein Patl1_09360 [Pistacia atlantica]|uniref:Uncharacterized protein n=1 Tax=Pistacia atlantica TaxID=434234 RepID=A0ACC1AIA6_9ROSI|nr:hypothetical protein Patl1_09360 [Pistacia atlantica]
MGEGGGPGASRELDQTPTWAVALVCSVIVLISIILEQLIHLLGKVFQKRRKVALFEALEKIKDELMLLGFISLLLSFGQNYIAKICIPTAVADTMLPCPKGGEDRLNKVIHEYDQNRRRLLWNERRSLGGAESGELGCTPGLVPLISLNGLHQLHIFIFFLAAFHVMYSAITMMLGRAKVSIYTKSLNTISCKQIRKWKQWEQETHTEYDHLNDPTRFRLTHETSFVRSHTNYWMQTSSFFLCGMLLSTILHVCSQIRLLDYETWIYHFQYYGLLHLSFCFLTFMVCVSSHSLFYYPFESVIGFWWTIVMQLFSVIPLIVILSIGAKLQGIISQMAFEIKERHAVIQGIPLVQVSDSYFWFHRPQLILDLIHFVLVYECIRDNIFLMDMGNKVLSSHFMYEFGLKSCFHDDFLLAIIRVVLGVAIQFLCSYSTLPLYALVTQMGSNMKRSIFDDQTSKALKQWHKKALKKNEAKSPVKKKLFGHGNSSPIAMQPLPSYANHKTGVNPDQNPNIGMDNNGDQHRHHHQHHDTWPPSQQPPDLLISLDHSGQQFSTINFMEERVQLPKRDPTVQVHFDCMYRGITAISSRESKLLAGNRSIAQQSGQIAFASQYDLDLGITKCLLRLVFSCFVQPYEFKVGAPPGKERKREFVDNPNGLFSAQAAPKPPPAMYSVTEGMKVGGKRTVIVPPEFGYGKKGMNEIPPGSTFDLNIELLEVIPPEGK